MRIAKITKFSMIAEIAQGEKEWVNCTTLSNGETTLTSQGDTVMVVQKQSPVSMLVLVAAIACLLAIAYRFYLKL